MRPAPARPTSLTIRHSGTRVSVADDVLILLDPHPRTEAMIYTAETRTALTRHGRVVAHFGSRAPDALVESILPHVNVIIGQTAMPESRLARAPKLKAIINVKGNWEPNIDYPAAARRRIQVLSAAPAMAPAVAEYCLAQALCLARQFDEGNRLFRDGRESWGIAGNRNAETLFDADVGFVGFGNLGRTLAPLLGPFGCRMRAFDPWVADTALRRAGVEPAPLDDLLANSQFLFLLAGVTTENSGFIDRRRLGLVRPDAVVVLASRAKVIDFEAFLEMAAEGRFRAAVDVFPDEPVPAGSPIRSVPNVRFTAHLAGGVEASYLRMQSMVIADVGRILDGLPPLGLQRADPERAGLMRSR